MIVNCEVREGLAEAVSLYSWRRFRTSRFGLRTYTGWTTYVQPLRRVALVAMETVGHSGKLYWGGWRPIWISRIQPGEKGAIYLNGNYTNGGLKLTFLRGTFDLDKLLTAATDEYNRYRSAIGRGAQPRYKIHHVFGTAGKPANMTGQPELVSSTNDDWDSEKYAQNRILQWQLNDIGTSRINHGNALSQQALSEQAADLVEQVRRWQANEDWYKERGIPWRRGWLLHGEPGTGKTSLVRAMAEDFDLPVFSYHLSTLYNNELQAQWHKMLAEVPCIALIEDIDAVFDGRTNIAGEHLTFDCLLNCLDGIERADGVLLIVTTNCIDKLDPALGVPQDQQSTRPGRIDQILELGPLDGAGRLKLCKRILPEWPDHWGGLVRNGEGETGAQFQERCTQLALRLHWI